MQEIVAPAGEPAKKLENFLKKRFPIGYVRRLFRKSGVRVNGRRSSAETMVRPGDRIQLYIPVAESNAAAKRPAPDVELQIVFEDKDLLIINKPAGLAVHEGKDILKPESILGILEAKYRRDHIVPRLVHRLDKDTSGLLIIAKSDKAAEELETLFAKGKVGKEYLCLVAGRLQENSGRIEFPLPGREGKAVRATTRFKVEKRFSETTLVRVQIDTGRMHQIRLHFSKLGYPVVIDERHGDFEFNKRFRKQYGLRRQFLHARTLSLEFRGQQHTWSAPLPEDLKRTLAALEKA
jgi:23S rRNA pseudouridine955/2504/2580 synthase